MYSGDLMFSKFDRGFGLGKHMDRAEAMYSGDLMFSMSLVWIWSMEITRVESQRPEESRLQDHSS